MYLDLLLLHMSNVTTFVKQQRTNNMYVIMKWSACQVISTIAKRGIFILSSKNTLKKLVKLKITLIHRC